MRALARLRTGSDRGHPVDEGTRRRRHPRQLARLLRRPGLSTAQRDALVKAVKTATETPSWKQTLEKFGWTPWFLGGDDYKKFLDEDIKRVGGILASLGLTKKS